MTGASSMAAYLPVKFMTPLPESEKLKDEATHVSRMATASAFYDSIKRALEPLGHVYISQRAWE